MHGPSVATGSAGERPTSDLSLRELLELNSYWLAINILWGALGISLLPILMVDLVCRGNEVCADPTPIFGGLTVGKGIAEAIIVNLGVIVAILVQPTVASISDHFSSRFGRRKPFIFIGTLFDMVFLVGLYFAGAWVGILLFYVLLQFSSNFAQGPFQGYMPDLVPARQVGLASGLMGLMILLGAGGGAMLVALINGTTGNPRLVVVPIMVIELVTMLITVTRVRDGRQGIPREGKSWLQVARSAWGTDILHERSYIWMLGSRLFLLMATATLTSIAFFFMQDAFGLDRQSALYYTFVAGALVIVFGAIATAPSGRASNRFGRKRMIYLAAAIGLRRDGRPGDRPDDPARPARGRAGRHRRRDLPRRRLGPHDRHHPQGRVGPVHGHQQRRDGRFRERSRRRSGCWSSISAIPSSTDSGPAWRSESPARTT